MNVKSLIYSSGTGFHKNNTFNKMINLIFRTVFKKTDESKVSIIALI